MRVSRKLITRSIDICFGRHVIAGTGLSASIVAGRHEAGESVSSLVREYGVSRLKIWAAIQWASRKSQAAKKGWETRRAGEKATREWLN